MSTLVNLVLTVDYLKYQAFQECHVYMLAKYRGKRASPCTLLSLIEWMDHYARMIGVRGKGSSQVGIFEPSFWSRRDALSYNIGNARCAR